MNIIVFPLRPNPYQEYLYKAIQKIDINLRIAYLNDINIHNRFNYVLDVLSWPFTLIHLKSSLNIFHLHWQFFYFLINGKVRYIPSILLCIWMLGWVKILGYKIIWTVHDYNQHDIDKSLDSAIRKVTLMFSDRLIVLNTTTRKNLIGIDRVNPQIIDVIPIGNYGSDKKYYPIKKSMHFTYSFFGLIRKYKGVERLIKVFKSIPNKSLRLKIIGDCYSNDYFNKLLALAEKDNRITIMNNFISAQVLNKIIHSSDVVVLPFLEVTNSSSAMMAFSKGRTVIAPKIGAFRDHPNEIGFFYENNDSYGLKSAMISAYDSKGSLEHMGKAALRYSAQFDWLLIGKMTVDTYKKLFN